MTAEPCHGFVVDINAIGAPVTIIKVTPDGRFYWEAFNELSAQHMDPTQGQAPGRELADFSGVSEDNICLLKGAIGEFRRCVESRSPFTSEAKYEQDDGLPTWVQNTFTPIFGESGAVEKILITSVEITQLKETQERLATTLTRVLSGFVMICATCKDIRNDLNQWERVETYLDNDANDVQFSHGYCPKCYELAIHELK